MTIKLGIIMDPIESIKSYKDSSFAMMLAAQRRGWDIHYLQQGEIDLVDGRPFGRMRTVRVVDRKSNYFEFTSDLIERPLAELDAIIVRTDPPFNMEYLYMTLMVEQAQCEGTLVVNNPQALRDANEKLFTAWFPQLTPPTLVTRSGEKLKAFLAEHEDIILKPLDMMGGASIFRLRLGSPNVNVIIETMTQLSKVYTMAQRYVADVAETGDKRVLLIDGEPVPYALARLPTPGETRANLAAGGKGIGRELTEHDRWICAQVAPTLREKGLLFVGLDIIGNYLTEINVTSPTGIRELDAQFGLDIGGQLMDTIAARL